MEESNKYNLGKPEYSGNADISTNSLATELLHEVKASSKRWFIAFIVVLSLWFITIAGFVWYISLPVEVSDTQVEQQSDNNSNNLVVGGDYNGGETEREKNSYEESNEK